VFQFGSDSPGIAGLLAWNLSDGLLEAARRATEDIPTSAERKPLESAAVEACVAVVSGRRKPWIELHRGELGKYDPHRPIRGSLRSLAAAAASALLLLSGAAWIRAEGYQRLTQAYQQPQAEIFRRLYPGNRVPVGISARLQSEHRKLAGTSGRLEGTPRLRSATLLLRDALAPLPEELRYRLLEIRLEEDRVYLDGEVRRHGDADLLADALRKSGFTVDAPRTENLADKGVAVTITATQPSGGHFDVPPSGRAGDDHPQKESSSP
jgi:type II secretory pathway component PulL